MKKLNVLASIGCAALMSYGVAAQAVTVSMATNSPPISSYDINLVSHEGNTWTYTVAKVVGKNLSHWDLSLGSCLAKVTNITGGGTKQASGDPSNANPATGADTSVKSSKLIKWDTQGGTFSITLDDNYPEGTVSVLAKTATVYNTGTVAGPNCDSGPVVTPNPVDEPPVEEPPVEEPPVEEPPVEEPPVEEPPVEEPAADCSDEAYAAANPEECTVTYGDDNAAVVKIWKYVGSMSVEEFDATYKEGVDYVITGNDGDYLLQGIDAAGAVSSTVGATLK